MPECIFSHHLKKKKWWKRTEDLKLNNAGWHLLCVYDLRKVTLFEPYYKMEFL